MAFGTRKSDGKTASLDGSHLLRLQKQAGQVANARLEQHLQRLACDLDKVPKALVAELSTRGAEVTAYQRKLGRTDIAAHHEAVHRTKQPKHRLPQREELEQWWKEVIARHGVTADTLKTPQQSERTAEATACVPEEKTIHDKLRELGEALFLNEHHKVPADIRIATAQSQAKGEVHKPTVRHALATSGFVAIDSARSPEAELRAIAKGHKKAGHNVICLAPSEVRADEMAKSLKVPSYGISEALWMLQNTWAQQIRYNLTTGAARNFRVNRLLRGYTPFSNRRPLAPPRLTVTKRSILLVDRADKLTYGQFQRLAEIACAHGAKIVASGSAKSQSAFADLAAQYGFAAVPRARGPRPQRAKKHATPEAAVSAWKRKGGHRRPKNHLLVAESDAHRRELNRLAQEARRHRLGISYLTHDSQRIYLGDRVEWQRNALSQRRGQRGQVTAVDPLRRTLTVKLDTGDRRKVNLKRHPGLLELGYATRSERANASAYSYGVEPQSKQYQHAQPGLSL